MNKKRTSLNRRSLFLLWVLALALFIGLTHRGMTLAQPMLYQGNLLFESWRFRHANTIKSENTIIYYTSSQKNEAKLIAKEAEHVLRFFSKRYDFKPHRTLPIFLFPDRSSMADHFATTKSHKANGIYTSGAVYLLNPAAWNNNFPSAIDQPKEWGKLFHEEGPLTHEITHYYLDWTTAGNYPLWYTEAFAQWVEYTQLGFELISPTEPLPTESLYTYDQLNNQFDELPNQALAYRQSFLFLRWMIHKYGEPHNQQLQDRLAKGTPFATAWQKTYGESPKQSYRKWLHQFDL
ncbi:hypothetical protein [Marininema halotolerans]|uniref:Peptidase MA superfamily protein n=1 Tax=Marininema halotolerans TaxID=1155944 RepID=A0A1I6P8V0_9BACL|nr:hypothetical protein [Marininema halotolerans]SFS36613.1 hypothetical protein SAMN05444972_101435 [Marininema halotolerans]